MGANDLTLEGALTEAKKRVVTSALEKESGNRMAAARRLGISRSYLHKLINELQLNAAEQNLTRK